MGTVSRGMGRGVLVSTWVPFSSLGLDELGSGVISEDRRLSGLIMLHGWG